MASSTPSQTRAVDPFASFNSNTVNQLTEMITRGENGLTDYNAMQVISDSTSPFTQAVVTPGTIYKDDVMITFTAPHVVNFTDPEHYVSFGSGWNEAGTYYIVLDYTYVKSRPAPQASVKILKPSQIPNPSLGTSLFFLKAVTVIFTGSTFRIDQYYDYDPANPDIKRLYTPLYFGVETSLPTHVSSRDQGRVIYVSETDKFYFGLKNKWIESTGGEGGVLVTGVDAISTSVWVGCIAYIDGNKKCQPAIATGTQTRADVAVLALGTAAENTSLATMAGTIATGVRVETGNTVGVGDVLYLSETEAGHVTSQKPINYVQDIGRALSAGDDSTEISMMFFPRAMLSTSIKGVIETGDWVSDSGSYRYDVDISELDSDGYAVVTSFFANNSGAMELLQPSKVQLIDSGTGYYDTLRVWMASNSLDVLYNISSGIGVPTTLGGGSGTTDHSLLLNLDYASSGHTGFAPDPHSNFYHSDPPSIPSGEIILFEKDTAVLGYTLLTTIDDELVYITKGSAAGGEAGGSVKTGSTWSQPVHAHIITPDGSVHTHVIVNDGSHDHLYKHNIAPGNDVTFDGSGGTISLSSGGVSGQGMLVDADNGEIINSDFFTDTDGNHDHGGLTEPGDDTHDHGGMTGDMATVNTWRPLGRNYTRQQKA